jgi:hypothetical protein
MPQHHPSAPTGGMVECDIDWGKLSANGMETHDMFESDKSESGIFESWGYTQATQQRSHTQKTGDVTQRS